MAAAWTALFLCAVTRELAAASVGCLEVPGGGCAQSCIGGKLFWLCPDFFSCFVYTLLTAH